MFSESDFYELPAQLTTPIVDVLHYPDILPDGREGVISGDPKGYEVFNHRQGDNPYDFQGTCGLVSCEDVLRQFGVEVTEADVVGHAIEHRLCNVEGDPRLLGGTTPDQRVQILKDFGVPTHVEQERSLQDLSQHIEENRGIIVSVNAGVLWNDPAYYGEGSHNHAIVVTGVARYARTDEIAGFFINDSGVPQSGHFVDAKTMQKAWVDVGGICDVTDIAHR